jgi:hypothetical protein
MLLGGWVNTKFKKPGQYSVTPSGMTVIGQFWEGIPYEDKLLGL